MNKGAPGEDEARKVVTVFFSDVAESTALGDRLEEAVALAREAAAMDFEPDNLTEAALRLVDLSEVLRAAGDLAGAEVALEHAVRLNDEKGNVVAAQQRRERLGALRTAR